MNNLQFEAKLATFHKLATIPEVMAKIVSVCDDHETPLNELADLIIHDVALTARLLKIVNSPLYGRPQQIGSIKQAVMTLGARQVKSLALSISVYNLASKLGSRLSMKDFWRHSLNTACTAELLAKKLDPSLAEEAFVCGMIHDIGVLALNYFYENDYVKVCQKIENGEDIIKAEQEILDVDHAIAGEMISRMWNFPTRYSDAIAHHHDIIEQGGNNDLSMLAKILNLANKLATFHIAEHTTGKITDFSNREVAAKNLGLSSNDIKEIEYEALSKFLTSAEYLEIDVGTTDELLLKAAEHLFNLYSYTESLYQDIKKTKKQVDEDRLDAVAVESLQVIVATFSHYLNNAVAAISGRTQLMELSLKNGDIDDMKGTVKKSIEVYNRSAMQITSVMDKLKRMHVFKTAIYHEGSKIIDLDKRMDEIQHDFSEIVSY